MYYALHPRTGIFYDSNLYVNTYSTKAQSPCCYHLLPLSLSLSFLSFLFCFLTCEDEFIRLDVEVTQHDVIPLQWLLTHCK